MQLEKIAKCNAEIYSYLDLQTGKKLALKSFWTEKEIDGKLQFCVDEDTYEVEKEIALRIQENNLTEVFANLIDFDDDNK